MLFAAFALPALVVLGPGGTRKMSVWSAAGYGWTHVRTLVREVLALPTMRRFLLGYFLYINGVNAAIYFSGPIAQTTFGIDQRLDLLEGFARPLPSEDSNARAVCHRDPS